MTVVYYGFHSSQPVKGQIFNCSLSLPVHGCFWFENHLKAVKVNSAPSGSCPSLLTDQNKRQKLDFQLVRTRLSIKKEDECPNPFVSTKFEF